MASTRSFGLDVGTYGRLATPEAVLDVARLAEDLDFDSIWLPDHVAFPEQAPDVGRGNALERGNRPHVEPEPREQCWVAGGCASEAEAFADDDDLRPDPSQDRFGEFRGLARRKFRRELDHEDLVDTSLLEQLEAAFEGREELHSVSQHQPRMWPERHDRAGLLAGLALRELGGGLAACVGLRPRGAVTEYLDDEPLGQGVHDRDPHPMQATRYLVSAATEFASGVQHGPA